MSEVPGRGPRSVNDPDRDDYEAMIRQHLASQSSTSQAIFDVEGRYTGDAIPQYRVAQFSEPQSVPDPDGAAYDRMLRDYSASADQNDCVAGISARQQETADALQAVQPVDWRKHPSFGESLIPIWGSTREAIADWNDGDRSGAILNGALAATDLLPGFMVAKGLEKAGVRAALAAGRSRTYGAVRKRMARAGYLAPSQVVHHAIIPQSAKWAPDWLLNHPANLKPLDPQVHKRIHSRDLINGLERFDPFERLWFGTPTWAKVDAAQGLVSNLTKLGRAYRGPDDLTKVPPPLM